MRTVVVFVLVALGACSPEVGDREDGPVISDSAGIRIVEFTPRDRQAPGTQLVELFRIGDSPDGQDFLFTRLVAGKILPGGSVVIADANSREVLLFSADGSLVRRHGREGGGPGEYEYILDIGQCAHSGFTVFDISWTLSVYDDDGQFIEEKTARFDTGAPPYALACDHSGRFAVMRWDESSFGQQGLHVAKARLRLLESDGSEIFDLGERIGSERFGRPTGSGPHPIGRSTRFGFSGSDLIVTDGTFFGFERWNAEGRLEEIVRLDVPPLDADVLMAAYIEQTLARAPDDETRRRWRLDLEAMGLPSQASFFSALRVSDNRILMQETSFDTRERWFEFQSDGTPLGEFLLPPGAKLLDVREDLILVEERGEFDVPSAVLYSRTADHAPGT